MECSKFFMVNKWGAIGRRRKKQSKLHVSPAKTQASSDTPGGTRRRTRTEDQRNQRNVRCSHLPRKSPGTDHIEKRRNESHQRMQEFQGKQVNATRIMNTLLTFTEAACLAGCSRPKLFAGTHMARVLD